MTTPSPLDRLIYLFDPMAADGSGCDCGGARQAPATSALSPIEASLLGACGQSVAYLLVGDGTNEVSAEEDEAFEQLLTPQAAKRKPKGVDADEDEDASDDDDEVEDDDAEDEDEEDDLDEDEEDEDLDEDDDDEEEEDEEEEDDEDEFEDPDEPDDDDDYEDDDEDFDDE